MSREARFWDRIAARYAKQPVADEAAYQKKLAKTREYFPPDMAVLEFGCGTGSTAMAHAPYVAHARATDLSDDEVNCTMDALFRLSRWHSKSAASRLVV